MSDSYQIYTATAECSNNKPDENGGFANVTGRVYSCPEDRPYIDLSGPAKCVSAETCTAYGYTLDVPPFRECMRLEKCKGRGYFVHKETRRCITLTACLALEPKHYAYVPIGECVALEPDYGGNFLVKSGNVQTCNSIGNFIYLGGSKA